MSNIESYEVQGMAYDQDLDIHAAIQQIASEIIPEHAGYGFRLTFCGENQATMIYHSYEVDLPLRVKEVEEQSETRMNEFVKSLKKRYKEKTKKTLKFKELKDQSQSGAEKVSCNNRYYYRSTRLYEF